MERRDEERLADWEAVRFPLLPLEAERLLELLPELAEIFHSSVDSLPNLPLSASSFTRRMEK